MSLLRNNTKLNFLGRALLYKQLATLQKAGLDHYQILSRISESKPSHLSFSAQACANKIKQGKTLDEAGQESGLFSIIEATMIKAALQTGTTDKIFATLAKQNEKNAIRIRKIKSRLFLPACILILSGFISPLPSLVSGDIDVVQYILQGLVLAITIVFIIKGLLNLPNKISHTTTYDKKNLSSTIFNHLINFPIIKKWHYKKESCKWLSSAALCLESGMPALTVIPTLNHTLLGINTKQAFIKSQQLLQAGSSVYESLKDNPYLTYESKQLIESGEASGRLAEMLHHSALLESQRLELLEDHITEWIPRIIYAIVVMLMASNIISSPITSTHLIK